MKKLRVTVAGKVYEVTVEVLEDNGDGAPPPSKQIAPSPIQEPAMPVAISPVHVESKDVASPLAGHVVAISVQAGQIVKERAPLMVLEAMKMNNYIYAPRDGRVSAIHVKVGDVVEEGQPLATIV